MRQYVRDATVVGSV